MYNTALRGNGITGILTATALLFSIFIPLVDASTTSSQVPTNDGAYTAWTPSTGVTHYQLVDESSCNGVIDYNSTTVVGNRDSYGVSLASVPNGSTITNIQITPCASRASSGGGSATMDVFYRFAGVNSADAGAYAVTGTTPIVLLVTNFGSLSFSKVSTSTLEVGSIYTSGTKGVRLSRMGTVITYTPPVAPMPTVTTNLASLIGTTTVTLNGAANPNGATTTGWFRYSTSSPGTCNDSFGTRAPSSGGTNLGVGTTSTNYSQSAASLLTATTYYYCAIASNSSGTSTGSVVSFTTI